MTDPGKINMSPRISLNKLGEFLTSTPSRRRKILKDQKYPSTFIVARYNDAEAAIAEFIASGASNSDILDRALESLENQAVGSDWELQTRGLNFDAVDSFYDIADQFDFPHTTGHKQNKFEASPMVVEQVSISVRPEVILHKESKDDKLIGAVKLYFSKSFSLDKNSGEYVASVLMEHLKVSKPDYVPVNKLCCVVDVFAQQVFYAPASYKRRLADVVAACQEISAIWDKL